MKACPTCGCEIADAASVCDTCEAWATALVEARPDADVRLGEDAAPGTAAPAAAAPAPEAIATVVAAPAKGSHGQVALIAAGVTVVALTGFAISVRGGSAPEPPAAAAASPGEVKPASANALPPATTPAVQAWTAEHRTTNYRRVATFELASENVVKTWFGPARASLVVRCTARNLEAFVVTGSPMKIEPRVDGKTVSVSMDGEPVRTQQWIDSDDHTAVFAPDAAAFVQRLRAARTFDFGYSPHNSSDVVSRFNVSGIDALIGAASKECGTRIANP